VVPVTLEDIQAELARRSAPPTGVKLDDVNAELQRRTAPTAPPAFDPRQMVAQGRETLSQENIGEVLGMAAGATGPALAAQGLRGVPMALRAMGVGGVTGAGDVAQQAGQVIRGEREAIDPAQAALATGFGAGGQALGEAAGTVLPGLARRVLRGGEPGRQQVQAAITDAARVGEVPTVAQATKNTYLDNFESVLAKLPGGAGKIRQRVQSTTANVQDQLEKIAQQGVLRGKDPTRAGLAVKHGAEDFVQGFKARAEPIFDAVTDQVGAATPTPVTNTLSTLQRLTTPIPGAEQTSQRMISPFLRELSDAVAADASAGAMPFQALQRVRSMVGDRLSNPALLDDASSAQVKQLYGAISEDLKTAALASGAGGKQAWQRANRFWSAGRGRIDDVLTPLVRNKVPEKIYKALVSGAKDGPTQLRTVMRSLKPEQQDMVTGTMIKQLGKAQPSVAGEVPEFSFSSFLTRWNQLDDAAKDAFFKRGRNIQLGQDLDALARYAGRVRESSKAFANPSGTSGATIGSAAALATMGSVAAAPILGGGMLTLPLVIGLGIGGANRSAAMMTSPKVVHWLAQATRMKPDGVAAHLGRLSGIAAKEDPETKEAILSYLDMLQSEGPQ